METPSPFLFILLFMTILLVLVNCRGVDSSHSSAVGDPGMQRDGLRIAFEAWNFCNEVGEEAPGIGSPRAADCFDVSDSSSNHKLLESPNFKVRLTLDVKQGGGPKSQFYLIDIGSCWKNNGAPCDGNVLTYITRYSEMIINPETPAWCSPTNIGNCPPFHIIPNNTKIYRNETSHFPYSAYHYYCAPGNAEYLEKPYSTCDPYSNPQAQELVQLLPHPIWANYGYPTKQGDGWVGDARTWELDIGGLSSRLYFYQDPDTPHARRIWTSLDVGTEILLVTKMKWQNGL